MKLDSEGLKNFEKDIWTYENIKFCKEWYPERNWLK